ncbi:MAG: HAD hydrolase-like protein [Candidatus Marinimicrobia bacterium]|nr:HAD hydrolase-like protein [Candidatus Neomarinimicrobiota bacterium]MCF7827583.1 HAD hydrolase-like protein [Candidatus Neomarinimicrobiota bacterium]MCF7881555.1 HAD hydrolase-like protein [Candidatus Neomarinimicrobiota bacterium]
MGLTEKTRSRLEEVDLVVFDIDGVLIDTSESFPRAIVRAVERFGEECNLPGWERPSTEESAQFKEIPGFNNDWNLAEGLLLYKIYTTVEPDPQSLSEFLEAVAGKGGGLHEIRNWVNGLSGEIRGAIFSLFDSPKIRQLAMEYYAGEKYCQRLYGFSPEYDIQAGAIENESVMVDVELLGQVSHLLGIFTGRNPTETEIALEQIGFNGFPEENIKVDDGETPTKPNPEPLIQMAKNAEASGVLFIGDTRDDWETIRNFNQAETTIPGVFIQVTSKTEPFTENINFVGSVNDLLRYLIELKDIGG